MGCTCCSKVLRRITLSNFEIFIFITFLICFILIFGILFSIFRNIINGIFNYNYNELKTNISSKPINIFTVRLSSIDYLVFNGFWVTVEIYSDFIIFKMFNKALLVNDLSQLSLTGKFT